MKSVVVRVLEGDALRLPADLLALKYAGRLYGADEAAFSALSAAGTPPPLPAPDSFALVSSMPPLAAAKTLFVGVGPLRGFLYREIRKFSARVLSIAAAEVPKTELLTLTLHGPGYGLDEQEAFEAEVAGLVDGIGTGEYPSTLRQITFAESNSARALRLSKWLSELLPEGFISPSQKALLDQVGASGIDTLRSAGIASSAKSHAFVAMPFMPEMVDTFYYGIEPPIKSHGLLCERADLSAFTGDITDHIRNRIASATIVVADLTTTNPNVYLEVGYAWGRNRPTILLVRDAAELEFDVRSQRCLVYNSIRHLEELLRAELVALLPRT